MLAVEYIRSAYRYPLQSQLNEYNRALEPAFYL